MIFLILLFLFLLLTFILHLQVIIEAPFHAGGDSIIYLGYVIDFLYLHINQYYWPAFNFADIYISIGIIMIIVNMVKKIIKS